MTNSADSWIPGLGGKGGGGDYWIIIGLNVGNSSREVKVQMRKAGASEHSIRTRVHFRAFAADDNFFGLYVEIRQDVAGVLGASDHDINHFLLLVGNAKPARFSLGRLVRGGLRVRRFRECHAFLHELSARVPAAQASRAGCALEQQLLNFPSCAVFVGEKCQYSHGLIVVRVIDFGLNALLAGFAVVELIGSFEVPDVGG